MAGHGGGGAPGPGGAGWEVAVWAQALSGGGQRLRGPRGEGSCVLAVLAFLCFGGQSGVKGPPLPLALGIQGRTPGTVFPFLRVDWRSRWEAQWQGFAFGRPKVHGTSGNVVASFGVDAAAAWDAAWNELLLRAWAPWRVRTARAGCFLPRCLLLLLLVPSLQAEFGPSWVFRFLVSFLWRGGHPFLPPALQRTQEQCGAHPALEPLWGGSCSPAPSHVEAFSLTRPCSWARMSLGQGPLLLVWPWGYPSALAWQSAAAL